jgi:hypothetical protein
MSLNTIGQIIEDIGTLALKVGVTLSIICLFAILVSVLLKTMFNIWKN